MKDTISAEDERTVNNRKEKACGPDGEEDYLCFMRKFTPQKTLGYRRESAYSLPLISQV